MNIKKNLYIREVYSKNTPIGPITDSLCKNHEVFNLSRPHKRSYNIKVLTTTVTRKTIYTLHKQTYMFFPQVITVFPVVAFSQAIVSSLIGPGFPCKVLSLLKVLKSNSFEGSRRGMQQWKTSAVCVLCNNSSMKRKK